MKERSDNHTQEKNMESQLIYMLEIGIVAWYPFSIGKRILYVGEKEDSIGYFLTHEFADSQNHAAETSIASIFEVSKMEFTARHRNHYDYIVCMEYVEQARCPEELLSILADLLSPDGILLLGMNNRYGIRFLCGDLDIYTKRIYDGWDNYQSAGEKRDEEWRGRCYSRSEIEQMLTSGGFSRYQFFSALNNLKHAQMLYREGFQPNEDLASRTFPTYDNPDTVFLNEKRLYQSLIDNGMFHAMANSFLIECAKQDDCELSDIVHVTTSMERGREQAMITTIHENGLVRKRAAFLEGKRKMSCLYENMQNLERKGIPMIPFQLIGDELQTPFIDAETGHDFLKKLAKTNKKEFLLQLDFFRDRILQSSQIISIESEEYQKYKKNELKQLESQEEVNLRWTVGIPEQSMGIILRNGYVDMVPLNSFYVDGTYMFFDQEFCEPYYPVNAILSRVIVNLYFGDDEMEKHIAMDELYERYGMLEYKRQWQSLDVDFIRRLRHTDTLREYYQKRSRPADPFMARNRFRMNFSADEYDLLFNDIFRDTKGRDVIVFGTGRYAERFCEDYGDIVPIRFFVDNDTNKWAKTFDGVAIESPAILESFPEDCFKVIICAKEWEAIYTQLKRKNVKHIGVFNPKKRYPLYNMDSFLDNYVKRYVNLLDLADTRQIVLFGSGKYASKFLAMYGDDYHVVAAVDNDESKWGTMLYREGEASTVRKGVEIVSPEYLKRLSHGTYKVIVCAKRHHEIIRQLEMMGIDEYGIYVPDFPYERKRHQIPYVRETAKKYHVGYIAGVFDLFHVGHLNMFKRAKELCDYLIVGVVSEEGVRRFKKVEPFVPFEERIEMVRSCRYVDEAVEIPLIARGTEDAWRMHHFDVQFSGSDYVDSKLWQNNKKFLEEHGATLVFFPYTQTTSSTKIRKLIDRHLF